MTRSLYQEYFGISENPFSIIPDPQYLFMSHRHEEALAHLLFGVGEQGGFVLLTGEVGTGKTTVSRALAEQLPPNTDMAMILNPRLSDHELMAAICDEMHIEYGDGIVTLKGYFDLLNKHLLETHGLGRNPVLLIDEAQALPEQGLELVRLLTNLETSKKKLLQIILVGQPELNAILAQPHLRQTTQRITARYHLDALGLVETRNYIAHRLRIAGLNETVFTNRAIRTIHKVSKGIPRLINTICDRALLGAYSSGTRKIGRKLAAQAASEIMGRGVTPSGRNVWLTGALVLGLAGVAIVVAIDPLGQELRSKAVRIVTATLPDIDLSAIRLDAPASVSKPKPETEPVPEVKAEPEPEPEPDPEPEPEPEP
ncbi:MAG: AAA family ATPase, partial [Rhodospirillaceae bacterium]|nr:AAA family ATPase [Rhodospirillaceae bacterium]